MKIELSLTVEQINLILNALGQRPYVEVMDLVERIKLDAQKQLSSPPVDVTPQIIEE
jgi:hypothetical protein